MATNIPLGTYAQDGLRVGPFYSGQLPSNFVADINGVITSSSHDNYGPGVLLSPQNTWAITPAAPGGGFSTLNNLVGHTAIGAVPAAGNLTLLGDNSVTFLNNGVVQFDWPRLVTVTIDGADATVGTHVTIFGTDWYGLPMQHTYVVSAQQTYPVITLGGAGSGSLSVPGKAFYTVNRVYISAALPGNSRISLGCADVFGLPFVLNKSMNGIGSTTSIAWGGDSDLTVHALDNPILARGVLVGADSTSPATSITGDVRGLYGPSTLSNGVKQLLFTMYVAGADQWINQVANAQQLYMQKTGSATPQGVAVAPLTSEDLYGVAQFYTGTPS